MPGWFARRDTFSPTEARYCVEPSHGTALESNMPIDAEQVPDFGAEAADLLSALDEKRDSHKRYDIIQEALRKAWNARGAADVQVVADLLGASGAGDAPGAVSAPQAARVIRALDARALV